MKSSLEREAQLLQHSWDRHSSEHLDEYLTSATEDPRINIPSILTRALFADAVFPGRFAALTDEELRFGLCLTWLTDALESQPRHVLATGAPGFAGSPPFFQDAATLLLQPDYPVVDYISEALALPPDQGSSASFASSVLDTFESLWNTELAAARASTPPETTLRTIELACGSGNDFRFLHSFGFAPFLDYTGIDIAGKNIANARKRFPPKSTPGCGFRVGNAFATGLPDSGADIVFVHDLFEHLSLEALDAALAETARILRPGGQAWLHFFNLSDIPEHEARPHESYHWNLLSKNKITQVLTQNNLTVDTLPIRDLVEEKFGFSGYYNQEAALITAEKMP